jgi:hypothetical protein
MFICKKYPQIASQGGIAVRIAGGATEIQSLKYVVGIRTKKKFFGFLSFWPPVVVLDRDILEDIKTIEE